MTTDTLTIIVITAIVTAICKRVVDVVISKGWPVTVRIAGTSGAWMVRHWKRIDIITDGLIGAWFLVMTFVMGHSDRPVTPRFVWAMSFMMTAGFAQLSLAAVHWLNLTSKQEQNG